MVSRRRDGDWRFFFKGKVVDEDEDVAGDVECRGFDDTCGDDDDDFAVVGAQDSLADARDSELELELALADILGTTGLLNDVAKSNQNSVSSNVLAFNLYRLPPLIDKNDDVVPAFSVMLNSSG